MKWAISFILLSYHLSLHTQVSFSQGIAAAKSISDDRTEQIEALKSFAKEKQYTSYPDSLAQVYYAIAYRHRILGQDIKVISASERAIELFEEAQSENYQYSFSLSFLGESYQAIGQIDKSLDAYQRIVNRTPKGRDFSIYGYAAFRLAQLYQEVEDHRTALDIITSVLDGSYVTELSDFDKMDLNLAASISLSNLPGNNFDKASAYLLAANEIVTYSDDIDDFQRIEITLEEAALQVHQGQFALAANIYNQALRTLQSFTEEYDFINAEAASVASNASFVFYEMEAYDRSLEFASRSLELFDKFSNPDYKEIEALLYSNMAAAQRGSGNYRDALSYTQKGLDLFPASSWRDSRQKRWILDLLYSRAETLQMQGKYDKALSVVNQVDTLFDIHVEDQLSTYSVRQLQKKGSEYYKLGIDVAVELDDIDSYWYLSEKVKGLRLLRAHIQRRSENEDDLSHELDQIKREILLQEYMLDISPDEASDSIRLLLGELKTQRVALSQKVGATEIQGLAVTKLSDITHDTPIIQFQSGQNQLYGCFVEDGNGKLFSLGKTTSIENKIEAFRKFLEDPDSDIRRLQSIGNDLWKRLWSPFPVNKEKVTILPDEVLYFLPFDILVDESNEYVISNYEIGYAVSGTFLSRSSSKSKKVRHIDFIKPSYDKAGGLPALPYSDKETELVSQLFKTEIISENRITKKVIDSAFARSSVFHFSGHAIADIGNDERSFLALGDSDSVEDKLLLGELYSLRSPAQLVVLSACNTGVGSIIEGEGVESLTRGFLYAGAQSVINTLWTVDDQSTSKILGSVYKYLKESVSKSAALRQSKLDYLAQAEAYQQHPYYWAGIIAVGDLSPLEMFSINWTKHAIVLGLFVIAGWFLTWRYKKKPPPKIEFLGNVFE